MTHYAIFGSGRAGANIASYLRYLGHQVSVISHQSGRDDPQQCQEAIGAADIVAAAIPDDKIEGWYDHWRKTIGARTAIHFSGAMTIDGIYGFHPLYSFPNHAIDHGVFGGILFACPAAGPAFEDVFPGAPNPHFQITDESRAKYHALAVLSGNFASHIWNEIAPGMRALAGRDAEAGLMVYLQSLIDRFGENPTASLTGPLARKDATTVHKNLAALAGEPKLAALYRAFLSSAWPEFKDNE